MINAIHQGDQYFIPVRLKYNNEVVTPESVDDVIIKVGNTEQSYKNGELYFEEGKFYYQLTEEMTKNMNTTALLQVLLVFGDNKIHSSVQKIPVEISIIK